MNLHAESLDESTDDQYSFNCSEHQTDNYRTQTIHSMCSPREREDALLSNAVNCGDVEAEALLVTRFRSSVHAMLIKLVRDPNRAEDLTQETMIVVLEKLRHNSLDMPHRLSNFVFSTAKFLYFGWLRKRDNQVELIDSMDHLVSESCSPEDTYQTSQSRSTVVELIEKLSMPRDREILNRHYLRDQTKAEICHGMELSREHYDRVISRARARLKQAATAQ